MRSLLTPLQFVASFAYICTLMCVLVAPALPQEGAAKPKVEGDAATTGKPSVISIVKITDSAGEKSSIGLNDKLLVELASGNPPTALKMPPDAAKYVLFLDGHEVKGLDAATYDNAKHSLVYVLKRKDENRDLWSALLGSPTRRTVSVVVALGERAADTKVAIQPTVFGPDGVATMDLLIVDLWRLAFALLVVAVMLWLVFARARTNATLRDNLIPQIEPKLQTYSLARWQMAFWFVLIFCAFIFLYIVTWDYNTVTSQALVLMSISGATALSAVAVDVIKDSPADAVNRGLQALGFNNYQDVERVRDVEIPAREKMIQRQTTTLDQLLVKLAATTNAGGAVTPEDAQQVAQLRQNVTKLTLENNDWLSRLITYNNRIQPFLTRGWFKDVTTDLNGIAIHRLQVFCWTWVLGVVFLIGVYRNLAMPQFSEALLALMGISGAGYVGFKYPEKNN